MQSPVSLFKTKALTHLRPSFYVLSFSSPASSDLSCISFACSRTPFLQRGLNLRSNFKPKVMFLKFEEGLLSIQISKATRRDKKKVLHLCNKRQSYFSIKYNNMISM